MKKINKILLYKLVLTAVMAALAAALMMLELVFPFLPSFLKLDFSNVPALFTGLAAGPLWGILVCLVKDLIHISVGTSSAGVGELADFLLSAVLVFLTSFLYYKIKKRWGILAGGVIGSVSMALVAFPVNYFIIFPFYIRLTSQEIVLNMCRAVAPWITSIAEAVLVFNVPFNLVKGLILTVIVFLAYLPLEPLLKKLENKLN